MSEERQLASVIIFFLNTNNEHWVCFLCERDECDFLYPLNAIECESILVSETSKWELPPYLSVNMTFAVVHLILNMQSLCIAHDLEHLPGQGMDVWKNCRGVDRNDRSSGLLCGNIYRQLLITVIVRWILNVEADVAIQ